MHEQAISTDLWGFHFQIFAAVGTLKRSVYAHPGGYVYLCIGTMNALIYSFIVGLLLPRSVAEFWTDEFVSSGIMYDRTFSAPNPCVFSCISTC